MGEHWRVVEELVHTSAVSGLTLDLWIASAGYGLLRPEDLVEPYAATFATRAEDSITRRESRSDPIADASYWWQRLSERARRASTVATLRDLAAQSPKVPLVVALSGAYVRAVRDDLLRAASELKDPRQLLLVSAGASDGHLENLQVPTDARLLHSVGGTRLALNVRVVKYLIENAPEHGWHGDEVRRFLAVHLDRQPGLVRYDRQALTDDQVTAFIRAELANSARTSRSALLRALRDRNLACEQKRFGRLYESVLEGADSG
jgi:hypothetical protein